jgi:DNA-binding CsgD family transcriptional regulator
MQQLEILYFIITFLIGIISFGFSIFFYANTKTEKIKPFLYFYGSFSLIIIFNFITSYLRANIPDYKGTIYYLLLYLENPVTLTVLIFTIPYFIHSLVEPKSQQRRNLIFAGIALLTFVFHNTFLFLDLAVGLTKNVSIVKNGIFLAVIIYCWVILLKYTAKVSASDKFIKRMAYFWGLLLPVIINDTILLDTTGVKLFPVVYALAGVAFTNYYYKNFYLSPAKHLPNKQLDNSKDELTKRYDLSARELEVIDLLVKGKSYKQISEELFISLNTVKTHIRNIYPKLEVSSRHEIVNLVYRLKDSEN